MVWKPKHARITSVEGNGSSRIQYEPALSPKEVVRLLALAARRLDLCVPMKKFLFQEMPEARMILLAPAEWQARSLAILIGSTIDAQIGSENVKDWTYSNPIIVQAYACNEVASVLLSRNLPLTDPQLLELARLGRRACIRRAQLITPVVKMAAALLKNAERCRQNASLRRAVFQWQSAILKRERNFWSDRCVSRLAKALGK